MDKKSDRIIGIDVFKAIAIIMVVTLHLAFWNGDFIAVPIVKTYMQYCFRLLAEGVPLFLFVNGFLLFSRRTYSIKAHYNKTVRLFMLLLLWAVLLVITGNALSLFPERMSFSTILRYVLQTQVGAKYTGVLWFIQNLIALYLVFPMLKALFDKEPELFTILFCFVAFFSVGMHSIELMRDLVSTYRNVSMFNDAIGFLYRFSSIGNAYYLYYFMLGGIAYRNIDLLLKNKEKWFIAAVFSWIGACTVGVFLSIQMGYVYNRAFNYGSVFMTVIVLGIFSLAYSIKNTNIIVNVLSYIGKNTMSIYLIHYVFVFIMDSYFPVAGVFIKMLLFLFAIFGSCLLGEVIKKIPVINNLITVA